MSLTIEEVIERLQRLKETYGPTVEVSCDYADILDIKFEGSNYYRKAHINISPAKSPY